jgi:hypothetical protein
MKSNKTFRDRMSMPFSSHLANTLEAYAGIMGFNFMSQRPYVDPRGGFALDRQNLRNDFRMVGSDLRKGIEAYGKVGSSAGNQQKR